MNNINEMRKMLCDEIENLRNKKTTPVYVNAIVNATGKILGTIKLQMQHARSMGRRLDLDFMDVPRDSEK